MAIGIKKVRAFVRSGGFADNTQSCVECCSFYTFRIIRFASTTPPSSSDDLGFSGECSLRCEGVVLTEAANHAATMTWFNALDPCVRLAGTFDSDGSPSRPLRQKE